jgi:hypothetical protein
LTRHVTLPESEQLLTIEDVMRRLPGASERTVRAMARKLGCFRPFGRAMLFTEQDFQDLVQRAPECHSNSTERRTGLAGSYVAPSAEKELRKARARLTEGSQKKSALSGKRNSNVLAFSDPQPRPHGQRP